MAIRILSCRTAFELTDLTMMNKKRKSETEAEGKAQKVSREREKDFKEPFNNFAGYL